MGAGFDQFMQNPYWNELYEAAPSESLKEYYRLTFEYSPFVTDEPMPEDVRETLRELWLTEEDIRFLLEHASLAQAKIHYNRCLQAIAEGPEDCCVAASSCLGELRNPDYIPRREV